MSKPAPSHLSLRSRSVWRALIADYELGEHDFEILEMALVQLDRQRAARRRIDVEGLTVAGLHGPKLNPLLVVERHSGAAAARYLRQLGFGANVASGSARLELWDGA